MPALRSLLFAPGNHARRTEKAFTLGADAVILDLEDACPVAEKPATRAIVTAALQQPRRCRGYIRINALSTPFGHRDLEAVTRRGVDGIVVPKVETADELKMADWLVAQFEREQELPIGSIELVPIVETGRGLRNVDAIAQAGTRARRLMFGAGDFTLDMGLTWTADETEFQPYRAAVVLASRAAGLEAPLDTVWVDLRNTEGFKASVVAVQRMGFGGKLCIHPDQVPIVNAGFSPSPAQIARAKRIIAAFESAESTGSAAIQLDGQFIDYPFLYQAQRIVELADMHDFGHGS